MMRGAFAVWAMLVGLAVGLLGNLFFYGKAHGISFPLFTLMVMIAVLGSALRAGKTPRIGNLWPLLAVAFFALMVAVRADNLITFLNVLAVLALGALVLYYLPLSRRLDEDPLAEHVTGAIEAGMLMTFFTPFIELAQAKGWLAEQGPQHSKNLGAVGRGLLLALPVVLVFIVLLGSADVIFANYVRRVWDTIAIRNLGDLGGRTILILGLGWLTVGALSYGIVRSVPAVVASPESEERPARKRAPGVRLGMIETGIVLGSVDLLFAAFVLIQFTYFFGGQANISSQGLTYAQYARRGFFELVAVSVLALGLSLVLERMTPRRSSQQETVFRSLALVIVMLTGVMLASASQRMWLYEEAYGFTHLRVYVHVFMAWLGVLMFVFLISLFLTRKHLVSLGMLLATIGYLSTLNLLDVDQYIAQRNVERYLNGEELDTCYLITFSVDAVPAMVTLYEATAESTAAEVAAIHANAGWWLNTQLDSLDELRDGAGATLFSLHASRERAWQLLDGLRGDLRDNYAPCDFYRGRTS